MPNLTLEERVAYLEGLVRELARDCHELGVSYRALQLLLAERGVMTFEDVETQRALVAEKIEDIIELSSDPDAVAFRRRRRQMEGGGQGTGRSVGQRALRAGMRGAARSARAKATAAGAQ